MARHKFFIAGTDTDVGKTFISQALVELAKQREMSCFGLKPIAAGRRAEVYYTSRIGLLFKGIL